MKKNTLLILVVFPFLYSGQVLINPGTKTAPSSPAVSLEFGDDDNRGIVVPYVAEADLVSPVNGTLFMDPLDNTFKIIADGLPVDLTGGALKTNPVDTGALQLGLIENADARVIIGGNPNTDTTPGILVLADTDKAMVLPRMVSPHLNIKNPAAGTMAYDTQKKQLAVFNGTQWSFWKAVAP